MTDDVFCEDKKHIVESDRNSILKTSLANLSGYRHVRLCEKLYGREPVSPGFEWRCFLLERAVHQYKHHVTVLV